MKPFGYMSSLRGTCQYTYWRFVMFGFVATVAFIVYAFVTHKQNLFLPFFQLMLSRWYLIALLAPAIATGDLLRIWAKTIIANAHVQAISATVPGITVIIQIAAALVIGGTFAKLVSITPLNLVLWLLGSAVLYYGAKCFPKLHDDFIAPKKEKSLLKW